MERYYITATKNLIYEDEVLAENEFQAGRILMKRMNYLAPIDKSFKIDSIIGSVEGDDDD